MAIGVIGMSIFFGSPVIHEVLGEPVIVLL